MSELVTGEAVVLDIRLARPATRAIAIAIDFAIEFTALYLLTIPLGYVAADAGASDSLIAGLSLLTTVAIFVGYTTAIETLTRGKSIGKYALGLRVVRTDGGPIRFRHAFVRALAGIFADFFTTVGCGALFTSLLNSKGKRIGDILAGTVVIRERAPRTTDRLPEVPPVLATWAASADLSRVPDQLAMSARSFLGRFHELAPAAREALGTRLAGAMAGYVSPPPPPGVPDWAYLTAILAERRRRALQEQPPAGQQPGQHPTQPYASGPGQAGPPPAAQPTAPWSGQPGGQPFGPPAGQRPAPAEDLRQWAPPAGSPASAPPPQQQPNTQPTKPDNGFAPPG
ncbi:RDD family protein [Flindersiella endophytica]